MSVNVKTESQSTFQKKLPGLINMNGDMTRCDPSANTYWQSGSWNRWTRRRLLSLIECLGLILVIMSSVGAVQAEKRVVGYIQKWVELDLFSITFDFEKLTHINIAFENPTNELGDLSFDSKTEVLINAAHKNDVKVLISIGGGSAATDPILKARYFNLLTDEKRPGFVAKLADYVSEHRFDGLDVDIEGPSINEHYGAFVADLASALKPHGKLLTSALSRGYGGDRVPDTVFEHYDFINIMAYDKTGPWAPNSPGQHSSYEYAIENVHYWLGRGLPKSKAVLGVPFYGHGFGDDASTGGYSYARILDKYPDAYKVDRAGNTIWYNGISTIRKKARYVVDQDLGGVMIWALNGDVKGERSLLDPIYEVILKDDSK